MASIILLMHDGRSESSLTHLHGNSRHTHVLPGQTRMLSMRQTSRQVTAQNAAPGLVPCTIAG